MASLSLQSMISKKSKIKMDNLKFLKPGTGISVVDYKKVLENMLRDI